ncbi:MAG TPA: hypothetical protein ENI11_05145 [Actinobacteria bacterium]|nr:hypothetical protein [Actinomycetota bacterium]
MPEDKQTSLFKTFIGIFLVSAGLIILVWVAVTEYDDYSTSKENTEPISRQSQDIKPFAEGVFPEFIRETTLDTRKAYRFASNEKNQPSLEAATCYCACGHKSLLGCFISERKSDGKIVYAEHGAGCRLCVDEVLSVKKWVSEGKNAEEIGELIDQEYGRR